MAIRYANRKDGNHADIRREVQRLGWSWFDAADYGCPFDAIVGASGVSLLVEVKDPAKPPSERRLTPKEREFAEGWHGSHIVALTTEDIAEAMRALIEFGGLPALDSLQ